MGRERWNSRTTFILAAVGSAVGLGNAWRFPGIAYANGGGAFLIPYIVALITAGIPLLILELSIGKKYQAGAPIALKQAGKPFEALGWWALATSFVIVAYYGVVLAWVVDYLWYAIKGIFTGGIPWKETGAESFFFSNHLKITDSPSTLGGFSLPVIIGLVLAWIAIWYCIRNGVKSVGKIVKWTVPLPVILLGVLVIRAVTLGGSAEGLSYYLKPEWSKLLEPSVWAAAYGQVFFSLSVLFGIMIAYGSYLPKDSDINANALIITFADAGISFLAGFAVFGTLGYLAQSSGVPIAELNHVGMTVAFISYPEAIAALPGGAIIQVLFALVFFLMLFTLGIDSAFSIVEGIVAGLVDKFGWNRKKTIITMCFIGFAGGLIFATKGGLYWLDITDHWVNDFNLIAIGVVECIAIGWIYGADKLRNYFNEISEVRFGRIWNFLIKIVIPVVLLYIAITYLIENIKNVYAGYDLAHAWIGGWGVTILTIVVGIILAAFKAGKNTESADSSEDASA